MTFMGAIKQLHELRSAEDMPFYYKPAIAEVINVLLMDTQEVRHGRWVIERGETVMHCNSCGCAYEYYGGLEEEWNYCPHCGTRMDEVKDGV